MNINLSLDEWFLEYKPWNRAQCIALLEHAKVVSKLDIVKYILLVINGLESEIFTWNETGECFEICDGYATSQLNSSTLKSFLGQYAEIGTKFRIMFDFTEKQFLRGRTFAAFQNVLKNVLTEIIERTLQIRQYFCDNKEKKVNDQTISLLALEPYLDNDDNGSLLLVIRNLWTIFSDIIKTIELSDCSSSSNFNIERYYCNQTLCSIYKRIFIPHRKIRGLVYTLLEHCLRPLFLSIESFLRRFRSISELHSSEFLFSSKFSNDADFYYKSYSHNEINLFWEEFLHFNEDEFKDFPLFNKQSLTPIVEAIKASFALRKNGVSIKSFNQNEDEQLMDEFRSNLNQFLTRYAHCDESIDINTNSKEEVLKFHHNVLELPEINLHHFKSYKLPIQLMRDIHFIMNQTLTVTFESISRPIVNEFLTEVRSRYQKLFTYYTDFYLVQHPQHIVQYVYFLFPALKDAVISKSFYILQRAFRNIHQNDCTEFAPVLQFFQPNLYDVEKLQSFNSVELSFQIFNYIYFLPKFGNDLSVKFSQPKNSEEQFYNFWPLTQLFNPKITDIFNQLFQFILRLRYFQFIIGKDFILSDRFRRNELSKNSYLFRFRLSNLVFLFGRQMEHRLKELVQQTDHRFNNVNNCEEFLSEHQRFLEKLAQIVESINNNKFINNVLKSLAKYCQTTTSTADDSKTNNNRRKSLYFGDFGHLDRINQDDFFNSLL